MGRHMQYLIGMMTVQDLGDVSLAKPQGIIVSMPQTPQNVSTAG